MPGRGLAEQARGRVRGCAVELQRLEHAVLEQSQRFGPIFKEALTALETKLATARQRTEVLDEVGALRARLLGRELAPLLEALEDGLKDLDRLLRSLAARPAGKSEEMESTYDELSRLERWFMMRLRHSAGEAVGEGYYRCCGCGAFNRPAAGFVLGWCLRCGGGCHHHVS